MRSVHLALGAARQRSCRVSGIRNSRAHAHFAAPLRFAWCGRVSGCETPCPISRQTWSGTTFDGDVPVRMLALSLLATRTNTPARHTRRAILVPLLLAAGCLGSTAPGELRIADVELRVLFIGSSLTYTNDLPAMVRRLGQIEGRSIAVGMLAEPNASLEDHAARGTLDAIARVRADVVVLQQGPSSLASSRENLVHWSSRFAEAIREAGGEPALLMVWPSTDRAFAFDDVRDSYAAAAVAVTGRFIPAGESWRAAWRRHPSLALYGPDGFHPSRLGTLTAALTVHALLHERGAEPMRCPSSGEMGIDATTLASLCAAVAEAVESARPR